MDSSTLVAKDYSKWKSVKNPGHVQVQVVEYRYLHQPAWHNEPQESYDNVGLQVRVRTSRFDMGGTDFYALDT